MIHTVTSNADGDNTALVDFSNLFSGTGCDVTTSGVSGSVRAVSGRFQDEL